MHNLSDEELMLEYQKGVVAAMDELLRRYKNPIFHFTFRLCRNTAEAEDLTQEVFLRIHQYRDGYRPCGKFSTWIFSIAHNIAISTLRKRKRWLSWLRKEDDPQQLEDVASPDPSPQEEVSQHEVVGVVQECIKGLPFLQREALILREYEHLDYQEIAKILKKSLGAVKTLIRRARMNLKDKLLPVLGEVKGGL